MRALRALRANRLFCADEKRIRTEYTVMDKSSHGLGLSLSKIVDCARMCFSSARNRRSARTGRRPRKSRRSSASCRHTYWGLSSSGHCALCAPTVFSARMKSVSAQNTRLWLTSNAARRVIQGRHAAITGSAI